MKTLLRIIALILGAALIPAVAQTGNRYNVPFTTAFDTTGVVSPGAQLFFYQTGTSTPANTYSDSGLTTPNANPVVANGAGLFGNIFLTSTQQYKVVLEDVNGNTIWTADPVYSGGPYVAYAASIAALRLMSIKNFGTVYVTQYSSTTGQGGGQFSDTGATSCSTISPTGGDDGGVYIQTASNCAKRQTGGLPYNPLWFGAICGGIVPDGNATTSGATLTDSNNPWGTVQVGWVVVVNGAAASGKQYVGTVQTVNSAGSLTVSPSTSTAVSSATAYIYPNDQVALDATIAAANGGNAVIGLPTGQTCGWANPGSNVTKNIYGPGINLNGGQLWLGQTGPVTDTGISLAIYSEYAGINGPGVISGLYETDQNIAQLNAAAVIFERSVSHNTTLAYNYVQGGVLISYTKGRAILASLPAEFTINGLQTVNCGDFTYQHSGSPSDQFGRSTCVQIEAPTGWAHINNFGCFNAAQSCLLVDNLGANPFDNTLSVEINNCTTNGAGYYGLDLEQLAGTIHVNNCKITATGTPSGAILYGGFISRNISNIFANNVDTWGIGSNAFVVQTTGSAQATKNAEISNVSLDGNVSDAAQFYISTDGTLTPTKFVLNNIRADQFNTFSSGQLCTATNPQQMVLSFNNVQVSQTDTGATYDTVFTAQGAANTMFYILGRNSNLGRVNINSLGSNVKATYFDLPGVQMNGVTYTGIASATFGTSTANPNTSFTCP